MHKLQIRVIISPGNNILTPGQPVLALTINTSGVWQGRIIS